MACVRHMVNGDVKREVRSFKTTTQGLMTLSEWLSVEGCTHIVMEPTGVYWKPVWHILADGELALVLANAAHVKGRWRVDRQYQLDHGICWQHQRPSCISRL